MVIRALAVFERVIHHAHPVDLSDPERPRLEVDALLRPGDADGSLLLPTPAFMAFLGGRDEATGALRSLQRAGRIVEHQGISHIEFPLWSVVES